MNRLTCLLLSIALCRIQADAQDAGLSLSVGQNILLPGQNLWYAIQLNESTGKLIEKIKQYPTLFLAISDLQNNVIQRTLVNNKSSSITAVMALSKSILPGTYILSATLYSNDFSRIIEEEAIPIHILGGENDHFRTFGEYHCPIDAVSGQGYTATGQNQPTGQPTASPEYMDLKQSNNSILRQYNEVLFSKTGKDSSGIHRLNVFGKPTYGDKFYTAKLRDKLCFEYKETAIPVFVSISNAAYLAGNYTSSFKSKGTNFLYGYSKKIKTDPAYQMPGFYDAEQHQIYQFKRTDLNGENFINLPYFEKEKNGQYLDLISKEIIPELKEIYPIPKWICRDFTSIEWNKSHFDSLQSKLEKAEIISRIFNQTQKPVDLKKNKPPLIQPDNFIELTQYQLFENIELFLTEVVDPVKVVRSKGKPTELRLLRDDIKAYYGESPLLIINGKIVPTVSLLFDIPFREISTIAIFRSINATRKAFGPLGRFGVVEITTKSSYKLKAEQEEKIKGFEPVSVYSGNEVLYHPDDPTPHFTSIQFFGFAHLSPFCYIHNDEKGRFLMQVISGSTKQFSSFVVN